jgi:amino acid adenylation domain-containing protein
MVSGPEDQLEPYGPGLLGLVLRHAAERPAAPALKDDVEALSYAELSERVRAVASGLSALGAEPGDRVVLLLPNSAALIACALACLWLGAAFVPLSLEEPPARLERLVRDCRPAMVVFSDSHEKPGFQCPAETVSMGRVLASGRSTPPIARDPERDAYLIYTSGTTGQPKGVRVVERAFKAVVIKAARSLGFDESVRALLVSSFHFDAAFTNAFPALVAGGLLVVPRREDLLFLRRFFRAVLEEGINHCGCSPSYLRMLLSSPLLASLAESQLTTFGLGGEECMAADVASLWEVLPGLRVFNRYGPTETTIEVTVYEVSRADVASGRIPLGVPNEGVSFTIVSDDGRILDGPDEVGELYIGGAQLMRGYWGDDELTARVLNDHIVPGETWYKTGDLVWRDAEGRYLYAGRSDDVVKRNGVRISLNEIVLALRRVEGVSGAACVLTGDDGSLGIAAFVEARPALAAGDLLSAVSAYLPASMLPDQVFIVPSLPMTSSGKVDRPRLLGDAG